jgi:diguanylate cyclase (GGDEF)-like protein/putative nucleotidyltransferase with HDIG domain
MKWFRQALSIPGKSGQFLGWPTVSFIGAQVIFGLALLPYALWHWQSESFLRFLCFLAVALGASLLKVQLPGIQATMSANFLFILLGILDLSYPETLLIGCLGGLVQSLWKSNPRPKLVQLLFNFANLAISIFAADAVFHSHYLFSLGMRSPLLLAAASSTYFAVNTMSVSAVIAMSGRRNPATVWKECYLWSFPYYLLGAVIAGGASLLNHALGWQVGILVIPVVYWIYRSYRTYLDRLEGEKKHTEEIAALHMRTIEALSLAIEAKDHTTHDHLMRVQTYAVEIGKDLGVTDSELNAVRAASLLHDIGKLAVPEHILSKPGKLTPEEFEKMKIHPIVGSEILSRVQFPYPVAPIVRSHHEKWNGKGYPDGLRGEQIPVGARILSVVDCFDALTSERPYRRAMSPEDAMNLLKADSGQSFDPRVVECIGRRYHELEAAVKNSEGKEKLLFSLEFAARDAAPSAGFSNVPGKAEVRTTSFLASIVSARQEAQLLFELAQTLGNSLSMRETLSVVAVRLKEMIPHQSIVFYLCQDRKLVPKYAHGVDYDLFNSLEIPMGQGISGWVAQNQKPIINGDPASETKYRGPATRTSVLKSALSVPLRGRDSVAGVLTLYIMEPQGFTNDHLRLLLAASSKLGLSMENAMQFEHAEDTASTDFLTGLPNARAICLNLEKELARSKRSGTRLAVMLCDLNGFKSVNDSFGHLVGNKLLNEVGKQLKAASRDCDEIGRLGGDEFVLILPECTEEGVEELRGRLESAVDYAAIHVCGTSAVTVSIGCAFYPNNGLTVEELLSEADQAMYLDKAAHYKEVAERDQLQAGDRY